MATKTTQRRPASARPDDTTPRAAAAAASHEAPQGDAAADAMTRLACSQVECCLNMLGAMFRAAETMRSIQLGAARSARRTHEQALERITGAPRPADLVGVATELMRFDADGSVHYWQAIGETMARLNADLMEVGARDFAALSQQAMQALNAATVAAADPTGALPTRGRSIRGHRSERDGADAATDPGQMARQAADVASEAWQRWLKMSEDFTRMALQPTAGAMRETTH